MESAVEQEYSVNGFSLYTRRFQFSASNSGDIIIHVKYNNLLVSLAFLVLWDSLLNSAVSDLS